MTRDEIVSALEGSSPGTEEYRLLFKAKDVSRRIHYCRTCGNVSDAEKQCCGERMAAIYGKWESF
jgi:translation elongation factor EF-Tu-like GTPase